MLQHPEKYLYLPYVRGGGLDSKLWDLEIIINAALSMNRIPIIKEMQIYRFNRSDNMEQDTSINWDKYIDLSKAKILKTEPSGASKEIPHTLQYVYERDFNFNLYSKNQIRFINSEQVHDKENDRYPIICLLKDKDLSSLKKPIGSLNKLKFGRRVDSHYDPSFFIIFPPSKEVNDLTEIVLGHFGTTLAGMNTLCHMLNHFLPRYREQKDKFLRNSGSYACVHVRYGINAEHASVLLKQQSSALKKSLKKTIKIAYKQSVQGLPLYIMSNIAEPDYFNFLKRKYDVYRYTDFKELRERFVEQEVIDHDLLYSVENNIMRHALVKIFPVRKNNMFVFKGKWNLKGLNI
ncbi:MAG: hypothetical protein OXC91_07115 [Rhodobacteraceae bacterium]|nr:hypothetical protein [Paracoccaceae bacterium]